MTKQTLQPVLDKSVDRPGRENSGRAAPEMLRFIFRYGGAVLAVAAAAGLRWLLQGFFGEGTGFITFYPTVALVAILAGGGPGVLATILSAAVVSMWFLFRMHFPGEILAVGLFSSSGLLVSAMAEMLRRVEVRKMAALEEQVVERTRHLEQFNARLRQEIKERQRAEEALRQEHELSESIINTVQAIVLLLDGRGRILRFNPFMECLTGWQLGEVRGRHWFDTFLPERDRERIRNLFEKALGGERVRANVNAILTRDGQEREIEWFDAPLRNAKGELIGLLCTGQDITDRRQTEQALRDSERRLKAFLDNSALLAWMKDEEGKYAFLSENYLKRFQLRFEDWQGKTDFDLWPPETAQDFRRNDLAALAENRAIEVIEKSINPDGSLSYWLSNKFPFQDGSGKRYVGGLGIDVTERKRAEQALLTSEERLRAILNTATDAIITIDQRGIIQSVNPAVERMFGYSEKELIGEKVNILMPPPYCDEHDGYMARYLATGKPHVIGTGREIVGRRRDGTLFPVDLAISEMEHLKSFAGIIRDITQRKELEREVVEIASLEQRRIGQDLHDTVGQELTALNLLAGDLAETLLNEPVIGVDLVKRIVEGLQRSHQELRAVLRGLLPVAVDTEGLMASLADLADRIQQEGKANCTFHCPEPVFLTDNLTATHLYLIAREAVHNALKHGRPRNIRITLESNHLLIMRVQDDGIGMPVQVAENHGGLGLRIMRNRAAIISARFSIESAEPTGTVVTCALARRINE